MTITTEETSSNDSLTPQIKSPAEENPRNRLINTNRGKLLAAGISTFIIIYIVLGLDLYWTTKEADFWGANLKYYPTEINSTKNQTDSEIDIYIDNASKLNPIMAQRVKGQLEIIADRAKTHLRATRDLNIWYYAFILTTCYTTIIAGLCLADITRQGWANANPYILGIFLVTLFFSVFSGTAPTLFQFENNLSHNSQLYISYVNLEQGVLTSLASLPQDLSSNEDSHTSLENIINDTNKHLQMNNSITIKYDSSKIPNLKDLSTMIGKTSQ